ncbi:MAG: flagellar basal body P-ring protein FlgI [Firmicutes bacterium]|nr:flagellar basal body P-ring protein FlgI [Bacillota bacterium]
MRFNKAAFIGFVLCALVLATTRGVLAESRIKDIAGVEGVRENDLIGYGLVVGLKGTGDSGSAMFTVQSIANMLMRFGVTVSPDQFRVRNVAAVMVTAKLPAFARVGDSLDVAVSSIGDARSLEGGTLLMTPLYGPDENLYAAAQGQISLGGSSADRRVKVHPTVARIPGGATVEQALNNSDFGMSGDRIVLTLKDADFTTADRVAKAICERFGEGTAKAEDAGAVSVRIPRDYSDNVVGFLAKIEEIPINADAPAKVVFNERTGTVVIGGSSRVLPAVVSHGNLRVQVLDGTLDSVTGTSGETVVPVAATDTVDDLVAALNAIGATPHDIIAILQALKACGALLAEIEVL